MDPDYYTGACHKWMMTPKGSSFLYTRKDRQAGLEPLVVSWGYKALFPSDSQFLDYHQFNGTRDFSAFLTIPDAIRFMEQFNWQEVSRRCRELVRTHAAEFFSLTGGSALAPLDDRFTGQMLSTEIRCREPEKLHDYLLEKYRIQIPVMRHGQKVYLRYSINAFNEASDLEKLFAALREIRQDSHLLE
jgi:isopenicillin-N epimerase